MADSIKGRVPFEAGGKSYALRLSINAQAVYEEAAGESVIASMTNLNAKADSVLRLRRMFWAGLQGAGHVMTLAQAGDLMEEVGLNPAARLVTQAFLLAYPQPDPEEADSSAEGDAGNSKRGRKTKDPAAA